MATKFVDFERIKLHEQVWARPLAQSYGVSNAEVKRAAEALGVPLPPSGHWTKVAPGKGIATPELAEFRDKATYRHSWWVNDETASSMALSYLWQSASGRSRVGCASAH